MRGDVLIVQPYVPAYRQALFDGLVAELAADGIECKIAAPRQLRSLSSRGDHTLGQPWRIQTRGRSVRTPWAEFSSYGSVRLQRSFRAVVAPAAASCLDAQAASWLRRADTRVGLWGHIDSYVNTANGLDNWIESRMYRRAHHVFAYTPGGARAARQLGVPEDRVTTLMNTIDVDDILFERDALTAADVNDFRDHWGVGLAAGCFIGGLDSSKRIDLLAQALDVLWARDPGFKLLVGGDGADKTLLEAAVGRGQVRLLGRVGPREKALLSATCNLIINPGRIGLLAVDALAMGLPVVTSDEALHAPEVEYLKREVDLFSVTGGPGAMAAKIRELCAPGVQSAPSGPPPSMEDMTTNFARGVRAMLGA